MSYYDEQLILRRVKDKFDARKDFWEGLQLIIRRIYGLLYNVHRGKSSYKKDNQLWPVGTEDKKKKAQRLEIIKKWNRGV